MNYIDTFISVAPDTTAKTGTVPPARDAAKSIARLEFELISARPHAYTQEEVQFAVHLQRRGIRADELATRRTELWSEFFSKPMACMRCSPLPKSYGWGLHFDGAGRVALVAMDSAEYRRLSRDARITQVSALRSKRA